MTGPPFSGFCLSHPPMLWRSRVPGGIGGYQVRSASPCARQDSALVQNERRDGLSLPLIIGDALTARTDRLKAYIHHPFYKWPAQISAMTSSFGLRITQIE